MDNDTLNTYRERIRARLAILKPLFAQAAVGDFSSSIDIPEEEDEEIIELYTGVNIMLDVIKRQLEREETVNRAKSEFVALVSHQLRTPLSVIKWSVEHLELTDLSRLDATQKEDFDDISNQTERMIELVNTILDVSRIELGTFSIEAKSTDFAAAAQAAAAEVAHAAGEKGILIDQIYTPESFIADADPALLHIILQNLLSNAMKYTPPGGTIRVIVTRETSRIYIEVSDTGYGIPEEQHQYIFAKLFRAPNARKVDPGGSGLGLYIVKSIVKEAGGDIWFESTEGKGTRFFVTFPLSGMRSRSGTTRVG